jgi:thiamine-monophosphate kinase
VKREPLITPSKAAPQSPATVSDYSERELVARIQQRLPAAPGWILVGIGDDAAVVEPERNRVEVLSVDAIVEGVHFDRAFVPPEAIGHRAMAVNLSDLAAMGAAPRLALVSMVLPSSLPVDEFDGIADGLTALAARHGVQIAGGNLTRSPGPLVIDVTIIGTVKRRQALTRAGARPGDELYVTGTVGTARAGLALLRAATSCQSPLDVGLAEAYLHPMPRLRMGTLMGRNRVASACMDLSDGLADAVRQVAEAGGVGAIIDGDALPIDAAAREWFAARGLDPVVEAAAGGDDYELLFAVRPRRRRQCEAAARRGETRLTRIGVCTADRSLVMTQGTTRGPLPAGYGHFRPFDALRVDELRVVSSDVEGR